MVRLGLRLTLRSGREALTRLLVTSAAVAVGVGVMLAVLADFHAFEVTGHRPNWEGTQAMAAGHRSRAGTELWNYSDEVFRGQTIERLDVAALGSHAPVPPGISRLPGSGQYYASPALAALIRSVPRDQLADRFPGSLAGQIGSAALTGPDELVIYVGDPASTLAALPGTIRVDQIAASAGKQVWSPYFRDAFVVGALAFLFPILILIGTATKLASARREQRYAALRLVGATARDVSAIASVDAVVSALCGTASGIGIFALVQPALAATAITSAVYFPSEVTPTIWGYLGVLVAVPAASAVASLLALRRVRISPLGVSRRVSAPAPHNWRVVPLVVGVLLFVAGILITNDQNIGGPAFPGLLLIMIGLIVAGPWLTARAAAAGQAQRRGGTDLRGQAAVGQPAGRLPVGQRTGARGLPRHGCRRAAASGQRHDSDAEREGPEQCHPGRVHDQSGVRQHGQLHRLGPDAARARRVGQGAHDGRRGPAPGGRRQTARGAAGDARRDDGSDLLDPGQRRSQPARARRAAARHGRAGSGERDRRLRGHAGTGRPRRMRAWRAGGRGQCGEPIRRQPHLHHPAHRQPPQSRLQGQPARPVPAGGAGQGEQPGRCSLAVAVGGGLVERKRPFTMLRLTGAPTATLYQVAAAEAVLPLVAAIVVAAGTAYGISVLTVAKMAPPGTPVPDLGHVYYLTMGAGLLVSLLVIAATLPLLGRITGLENVRFE